jgi:hypothetical protein
MIEPDDEPPECPHCKGSYEVAAVKLSIVQPTAMVLVCRSCGLARVEVPPMSATSPRSASRIAMSLMVAAPVLLYIIMWLFVSEHQPVQAGRLATSIEQSGSRLDHLVRAHPL